MTTGPMDATAQIRQQIDRWSEAFRAKDLDAIMAIYESDIVSFDIVPPLQYVGADAYRKPWQDTFAMYRGSIDYQVHNLSITANDDLAFVHSLNRMAGTMTNGQQTDFWLRWTACFRKRNGTWLITHEQVSVPVDLATGTASLDLEP